MPQRGPGCSRQPGRQWAGPRAPPPQAIGVPILFLLLLGMLAVAAAAAGRCEVGRVVGGVRVLLLLHRAKGSGQDVEECLEKCNTEARCMCVSARAQPAERAPPGTVLSKVAATAWGHTGSCKCAVQNVGVAHYCHICAVPWMMRGGPPRTALK